MKRRTAPGGAFGACGLFPRRTAASRGRARAVLTRRHVVAGMGGLCAAAACMPFAPAIPGSTTISFEVPRGACDAHVHVVGNPRDFPMSPERDYTPPPATATDLSQMLARLHIDRVVIVTPTIYDDNSATLAAIEQLGRNRARGVALVDPASPSSILDSLARGGIVGLRLLLANSVTAKPAVLASHLRAAVALAEPRGWHLDISTPPDVIAMLSTQLAVSPVTVVLDYFGWVAGGLDQPGFDAILSLVRLGRAYVKLSEPYRLSGRAPDYPDLRAVAEALVAANPERVLWGSGWPHVASGGSGGARTDISSNLRTDTASLLDLLGKWFPNAETRRQILVDNPARLYGF